MCGRFTLAAGTAVLKAQFGLAEVPELLPRYNVAPTQSVAAVRCDAGKRRELVLLRWGLIPSWADDVSIGNRLINARAESIADKPCFRSPLASRRCLILADGFFEWLSVKRKKQAYHFKRRDGGPFAIAGLWERRKRGDEVIESCSLITTEANSVVGPVHGRMPAMLADDLDRWLDPAPHRADRLLALLRPYPAELMCATAVGPLVNSPQHDSADCVRPMAQVREASQQSLLGFGADVA